MSFMKKAQEAASQAADAARNRAHEAATAAGRTASEAATAAGRTANDPATAEMLGRSARDALGLARRGVTTVIEKIDPGTLAELIVRATALQELTNKALRAKGSPYRIAEISISASIPPAVSFAISRLDDEPESIDHETIASSDLVDQATETAELVLALDGTTVDAAATVDVGSGADGGPAPHVLTPSSTERD